MQNFRGIFNRKASKESEFDDLALLRVNFGQVRQSRIECHHIQIAFLKSNEPFVQSDPASTIAAFRGTAAACVVDQNTAHHLGSDSEEVRSILPTDILIDEAEVRFVYQRGALQCVARALLHQVASGQTPKLVINQGKQVFQRLLVALCPSNQKLRNGGIRRGGVHGWSALVESYLSLAVHVSKREPRDPRREAAPLDTAIK
jgi:hypothetical protein